MWNRIYAHENKICTLDILKNKWSPLFIHTGFDQGTDIIDSNYLWPILSKK